MQTLYFLIERHWPKLSPGTRTTVLHQLESLLTDLEVSIQQWTFICLTTVLVMEPHVQERGRPSAQTENEDTPAETLGLDSTTEEQKVLWQRVWQTALRRINLTSGITCRGASLMATALMQSPYTSDTDISLALTDLFEDLATQGPAIACDTVCAFIRQGLKFAENDARLYRSDNRQNVLLWFRHAWKIEEDLRRDVVSETASLSTETIQLLARLYGVSDSLQLYAETPLIDSSLYTRMSEEVETRPVRDFLLHAKLPLQGANDILERRIHSEPDVDNQPRESTSIDRKHKDQVLDMLSNTVKSIQADMDLTSVIRVKSALQFSIFSLITWSQLSSSSSSPQEEQATGIDAICTLLKTCLNQVFDSDTMSFKEKSSILSSLVPVLGRHTSSLQKWPTLIQPDRSSGVTTLPLLESADECDSYDSTAADALLVQIWKSEEVSLSFSWETCA